MRIVSECLLCKGNRLQRSSAVFSPFIAKRIWNRSPFPISLMHCLDCDFTFADSRFDPEEEQRLYDGYRGSEYQAVRESCEPWYTREFNLRLSTGTMERRRVPLAEIFRKHVPANIKTVLDFGGDRGDLFDGLASGATTYVYDISGVDAAPGVKSFRTLEQCAAHDFDLIGCSNVVEHVAYPLEFLSKIRRISRPTTLVFLEVPSESPTELRSYAKRFAQELILALKRPRLAASMLPLRFLRQVHEHVNFFSPKSLRRLMEASGFQVLASGTYPGESFSFGPYKLAGGDMAWCLCQIQKEGH